MMKRIIAICLTVLMLAGTVCGMLTLSVGAEEAEANTPADPDELAGKILDNVAEAKHPYILYSEDEIPTLREKVKSGISQKAFTLVSSSAMGFRGTKVSVSDGSKGIIGRQLQHYVSYLSIYAMIADKPDYAKSAVDMVVSAAQQGNVEMYAKINDALCVGDFGHAYAIAYDMLYDYMTEEQRALIKAEMEEIGEWIFVNSPKIDTWGSPEERRQAWNWNAVTHGALGLIALSLGDHEDWLALSIERMQGYYKYAVDGTGAAMEGLHYIGYAFNSLAPLDHAIYRLTGVEVLDAYPAMQSMPYWAMNMTIPQGGAQVAINQGDGIGNYSGPFYIINRYKQADALWGWMHTYNLFDNGRFTTEYQGNGWSAPALILFEDQSFEPVEPTAENNPLTVTYDKGLVIARDSWAKDASMVTFTCGYGYSGCWNHPDDNSFTFYAKGESFIVELGSGKTQSSDHNVVLANGKGMDFAGGATMAVGIMEENAILENGALYLRGNNLSSYNKSSTLTTSIRHFVYSGGETPFVIIFDYAKKASANLTFSTNFYTYFNNKVSVSEDGSYATIEGKNTKSLCYMFPFTPEGVTIGTKTTNGAKGLTTASTSNLHRQATVFITANPDGSMPKVEFNAEGKLTTVSITRSVNGESVTETYEFDMKELVSPEIPTIETTTETPTEVTETATTETATIEITETELETETEVEPVESETETQTDESGCNASVGTVAVIPVMATAAILICKKKKKFEE